MANLYTISIFTNLVRNYYFDMLISNSSIRLVLHDSGFVRQAIQGRRQGRHKGTMVNGMTQSGMTGTEVN